MTNNLFKVGKSKKNVVLIDENNNEITQLELHNKIKRISKLLKTNSIVIIIADNCLDFVASYIASMNKSKIITLLLDKSFSLDYITDLTHIYQPDYIICPGKLKIKNLNIVNREKLNNYEIIKIKQKNVKKLNYINYLLLSTSGTTQSPKFVRLSKNNILDNTDKIIKSLKIKKNQTTITTMPAGYSYGLSILNTHLKTGAKIILNNNTVFEKIFWEKVKKFKVNSFGGVPEFYDMLKKIDFKNYITKHIKYLTQAGGKLRDSTLEYIGKISQQKQIKFFVMYGQTEASPRISCLKWNFFFKKKKSIGKPLPGYEIKVFKNKKELKKPFTKGELVLFGKNVSLGYAKDLNDLKKGDVNKKVLFTGDLGFKDDDNFVYLSGRTKRIAKIFGKRFDLDEIENFIISEGQKIKCKIIDEKLTLELDENKLTANDIINKISKKYFLNKNFISISSKQKTFKNYV